MIVKHFFIFGIFPESDFFPAPGGPAVFLRRLLPPD
jgi:hypothetical protein